jgi:hypothetical protein
MAFCMLCLAIGSGIASAQDPGAQESASSFEACVSEARQKHTDAATPTYLSFKCEGATAQKLAARPDQCFADGRPLLRNIERRSRQLNDGLYLRIIWRTEVCAGLCETRVYNDTRETSYSCEVRRHLEGRVPEYSPQPRNTGYEPRDGYYPRDGYDYRPARAGWVYYPGRGWVYYYEPAAGGGDQPAPYVNRPRVPEIWEHRGSERNYDYVPGRYLEYRYPGEYVDDGRRDDYGRDAYRAGDSRRNDDNRADDNRGDGRRVYYYYR